MPTWRGWESRWNQQQTGYRPYKAMSLEVMMDLIAQKVPNTGGRVLDLAAGLGTITGQMIHRWPQIAIVAVDLDPVLLQIGQGLYAQYPQVEWMSADLRDSHWHRGLTPGFDAVVTASALHWLDLKTLSRLYQDIFHLLKPGGYFLNSDHMRIDAGPLLLESVDAARKIKMRASRPSGYEDWDQWWNAVSTDPRLGPLMAERSRRFGSTMDADIEASSGWHLGVLRSHGFHDAAVVWQWFHEALIMGVR